MNKLTTEHLLFAHRIGATLKLIDELLCPDGYLGKPGYVYRDGRWPEWNKSVSEVAAVYDSIADPKCRERIDFSPLYDWVDHDGGECPVRDDALVQYSKDGTPRQCWTTAHLIKWERVDKFRLKATEDWPENRADTIGQNGNTGEHYDIPPPEYDPRDVAFNPEMAGSKSKYHREISPGIWVDVYDVLKAWNVENPALQHLIKKALQPGERGHKTLKQDMDDIIASAIRAKALSQ